uniref:Carboxypeptidase N subunit 2 n=1 Tax=Suricata suricatta TaxID=37032 RepID=A0A673TCJ8_SURSU
MLPGAWLPGVCLLLLARPARPCPEGCDCFVGEVFCSDEGLVAVPLDTPLNASDIVFVETSFTTLGPRAFSGSPNLTKVVFLNTRLCCFGPDAFGGLPRLQDLEITGSALSNLSSDTFSNLTSLGKFTLNFDMLEALPEGLFHQMGALESLQLQGNQLQNLPARLFWPLKCLKTLNLAQNQLAQLPEELFEPLCSLQSLRLSSNKLSILPQAVFGTLGSLRELFLDSNSISELPPGLFAKLGHLEKLWLQRNAIGHLPLAIFSSLGNLTFLNLQGNMLQTLPAGLFAGTPALVGLSLSYNQLEAVSEGAFARLSSLGSLTLSHNAITHLPAGVFQDLEELVKLYLGSNNLTALHPALFQNLSKLELLSLSRNLLTTLPEGIFDSNYNLFNLALHGNPWQCDCHLAYLFNWLYQYSDRFFNVQTYCAGPAYLKGQVLPALKEEQLVCPVTRDRLGFQAPGPEDREPGDAWDLVAEERAAWTRCTYSNSEGTVVLACDEARCRWLNVHLSSRQESASPGLRHFNVSQTRTWADLASQGAPLWHRGGTALLTEPKEATGAAVSSLEGTAGTLTRVRGGRFLAGGRSCRGFCLLELWESASPLSAPAREAAGGGLGFSGRHCHLVASGHAGAFSFVPVILRVLYRGTALQDSEVSGLVHDLPTGCQALLCVKSCTDLCLPLTRSSVNTKLSSLIGYFPFSRMAPWHIYMLGTLYFFFAIVSELFSILENLTPLAVLNPYFIKKNFFNV